MNAEALLLVPVKPLARAKTRLRNQSVDGVEDLVLAMACDVLAAALAAPEVGDVVVISNDQRVRRAATELGARAVLDRPDAGLNASLHAAVTDLEADGQTLGAVICQPADCPAVTPQDFSALVAAEHGTPQKLFVSDVQGSGTTSLLSRSPTLVTHYGIGSASAHRADGFVELRGPEWRRLSRDVDTPEDLRAALRLGAGRHTTAWAARTGFVVD